MAAPPVTPIEVTQVSAHLVPPWVFIVLFLVLFAVIYHRITKIMRTKMMAGTKSSVQKSHIRSFVNMLRVSLAVIIGIAIFLTYTENFAALGISATVVGAIIGWVLQKPIEGIAAFFLIQTRKPFRVGDRVDIDGMKGDVVDITWTHLFLEEVSGTTTGQDKSGRVIVIPTNILFDKRIINYTMNHEYMLDEVVTTFTYDSNIDKAVEICIAAAERATDKFTLDTKQEPFCRVKLGASGIDVYTRYRTLVRNPHATQTEILLEVYKKTKNRKDIKLAYPVVEVMMHKKRR